MELFTKSILDQLNTAVIVVDQALSLQYLNVAAEILFSVSGKRVYQTPFAQLYRDADGQTLSIVKQASEDGQPYTRREAHWHIGGQALTVDYTVTPMGTHILIEVHALNRLLVMAQESDALTQQTVSRNLVRGLAHEIKNPLGGIRGAAQLLDRELKQSSLQEYTHVIIQEADRLRNLVDRLIGPKQASTFAHTNIHEVMERVLSLIQAEHPHLTVVCDYDPSLPSIEGDSEQLIQAILNIAQNAADILQGQHDGTIIFRSRIERQFTIGATRHRLVCRIDITDNGPGVDETIIDTIFYPLVSGRNGTGLGLSIAQTIIKQHRGIIQCVSELNKTVFSVFIPIEVNHE
jgi:two-component system nitrogen regulation sensor histidine kinase GlnL